MATTFTPTAENERSWNEWVESRPRNVREVARRFKPWILYRMNSTGQRITIYSFGEAIDGPVTLTVNITGEYNRIEFDRRVFGISPNDLEECELPSPDEVIGADFTQDQVAENIDEIRLRIRPDLWERTPDGSAVKKGRN